MLNQLIILLTLTATYLVYTLYVRPRRLKAYYSRVFKEKGYKVFQYPYRMLTAPHYQDFAQNQKQYGDFNYTGKHVLSDDYDIILTNILTGISVVILKPELIKALFHKDMNDKLVKKYQASSMLKFILQRGLLFIEKDVWKYRRQLISKVFNFQFIISQIPTMIKGADDIFDKFQEEFWINNPQKRQQKQIKIDLYILLTKYTSRIVMSSILGFDSMNQELKGRTIQEEILRLVQMSIRLSRDPFILMFGQTALKLGLKKSFTEFLQLNQEIDQILLSYIKRHRQNQKSNQKRPQNYPKSIIELILEQISKGQKGQNNYKITDQDLLGQIKTFLTAGTETTANFTTMSILLIFQHKHVLDRLRSQIQAVIKQDSDITLQNIKKIKYFEHVLAQCSRVYPTAEGFFDRTLDQDTEIDGVTYKQGTTFSFYLRPAISNPKIFEQPFEFKPERWFQQTEENKKKAQITSFQFSGGPRGCIGKHLALTEAKVMIIKFLKRYKALIEPGINNRRFYAKLTCHLDNNTAVLTKFD